MTILGRFSNYYLFQKENRTHTPTSKVISDLKKILCKVPKDTQYLHDYSIEPVEYTCVFALTEAPYSSLPEYLGANEEVHELADATVPTRP